MTTFAKKFLQNSYKTLDPEENQKSNERNAENSTFLTNQKSKKNNKKSKTLETKICKGVDGVRKFTKNSTKNPY